jgi:hypothetical protein
MTLVVMRDNQNQLTNDLTQQFDGFLAMFNNGTSVMSPGFAISHRRRSIA